MRKVFHSAAMSLDGYIARPNGAYDWIVVVGTFDWNAFMPRFDTRLTGRKMYEVAAQQGGGGMDARERRAVT